jgi:hypothetical protein
MITELLKLEHEILDYLGHDLIEEFTAYVASAIEQGVQNCHEHYTFLSRLCPKLDVAGLESILDACRNINTKLDAQSIYREEALRVEIIKILNINAAHFADLRLAVRSAIVEGSEIPSAIDLNLLDHQYNALCAYVNQELRRQIAQSRKQLRPKAYEGIGLSGELNDMGFAIREVFLGSDAHVQGIKSGDLIIEIMKDGQVIKIADKALSDQEKVNYIRSAHHYKILQDGQIRVVEIAKQVQNGIYRTTESISDKIRCEIMKLSKNAKPQLVPVLPVRGFVEAANKQGVL